MKVQIVHASVEPDRRDRYLAAWSEWSGTLLPMGIRTELLESDDRAGEFVEVTWFERGTEPALGDDRVVRLEAELEAAASERRGSLRLYRPVGKG